MSDITVSTCYFALRSIRRHVKNRNYGLAEAELDELGTRIDSQEQFVKGLRWCDE